MKDILVKTILEVGKFVKDSQQSIKDVSYKEGDEIVTDVDKEAERRIKSALKKEFPKYNYYGEEEGFEDNGSDHTFFIDPVDGTKQYVDGTDFYCVVISVTDSVGPLMGAIYLPNKDELFFAERGKGAFLNGKPIKVSSVDKLDISRVTVSSITGLQGKGFVSGGAIGVVATKIARGEWDGAIKMYRSGRRPFEGPAFYLLMTESGGEVTDFKGKPWNLDTIDIVFSNGKIHEELIELAKQANKRKNH